MSDKLKIGMIVAGSLYLGAGLFAGLLMQRAVPALNPVGVALIAATWPNQIRCARVSSECDAIPKWASPYIFTFSDAPVPSETTHDQD